MRQPSGVLRSRAVSVLATSTGLPLEDLPRMRDSLITQASVALPPLARAAMDRYLVQRGLPTTRARWNPQTPLIGSLHRQEDAAGITAARLWSVMRRFFLKVAEVVEAESPATAEKLRRASPHWMRHTHASHALARGAELTTVRDNLRHASVATTSIYLHSDEVKRARQMDAAFAVR